MTILFVFGNEKRGEQVLMVKQFNEHDFHCCDLTVESGLGNDSIDAYTK